MEYKHFSHTHGLVVHQVPGGSQIICSACKFSGTGSVYACWPCRYFLHDQCFRATRSMNHPSHQMHPLTLVPYPTYPSNSFFCNTCNFVGSGLSYSCANCEFDLHLHCALIPSVSASHQSFQPSMTLNYPISNNPIPHNYVPTYPAHDYNTTPNFAPQMVDQYPIGQPSYPSYPTGDSVQQKYFVPGEQINNSIPLHQPIYYESSPNMSYSQTSCPSTTQVVEQSTPQVVQPQGYPDVVDFTQIKKQIKHFSHNHPLRLSQVKVEESIVCSGCEDVIYGQVYSCVTSKCDFYLHKSCFELEQSIYHESHIEHPLALYPSPPYKEYDDFTCNACLKVGSGFAYHCKTCQYDLHVNCASLPKTVKRADHEHALVLFYTSVLKKKIEDEVDLSFSCDVCAKIVDERCWMYYCQICDFGTHLECIYTSRTDASPQDKNYVESILEVQNQMHLLRLQTELNGQLAQMIANSGQSVLDLAPDDRYRIKYTEY